MFTFGARALVPEHRKKIVLCSDTGNSKAGTGTVPEFWRGYLGLWVLGVQVCSH